MESLTRDKLIELIKNLGIDWNEGINADFSSNKRIVFWDYAWEPLTASGKNYNTIVTYQISFFNALPPKKSEELITLIHELGEYNINPLVSHEYVEKEREWHSFFSVEVPENV